MYREAPVCCRTVRVWRIPLLLRLGEDPVATSILGPSAFLGTAKYLGLILGDFVINAPAIARGLIRTLALLMSKFAIR
jgi:hypothetical protein